MHYLKRKKYYLSVLSEKCNQYLPEFYEKGDKNIKNAFLHEIINILS